VGKITQAPATLKQQAVPFRTSHHSGPPEIEVSRRNRAATKIISLFRRFHSPKVQRGSQCLCLTSSTAASRPVSAQTRLQSSSRNVVCRGVHGDVANFADLDRLHETIRSAKGRIDVLFASALFFWLRPMRGLLRNARVR